jgi:hypothetical protein
MAELLIRAQDHWMDKLTQKDVDVMNDEQRSSYESRVQKGDIVAVYPDGVCKEDVARESPFIIVKIPEMSFEEAQIYMEPLMETVIDESSDEKETIYKKMIRFRKYSLPKTDVDSVAMDASKVSSMTKISLTSKIIEKTGLSSEVSSPIAEEIM